MIQDCSGFDFLDDADMDGPCWSLYWILRTLPARNVVELAEKPSDISEALVRGVQDIASLGKRAPDLTQGPLAYCPYFIGEHGAKVTSFYFDDVTEFDTGWHKTTKMEGDEAGLRWTQEPVELLCVDSHTATDTHRIIIAWRKHVRSGALMVFILDEDDEMLGSLNEFIAGAYGDDWCLERHERVAFLWREK